LRQFGRFDRRGHDRCHPLGDAVLKIEDVLKVTIELLGPETDTRRPLDQLGGDAQTCSDTPHRPFQQVVRSKFGRDSARVGDPALVDKGRCARDYGQLAEARQRGQDIGHHAIGEIVGIHVA
jgi:hypothetical protein